MTVNGKSYAERWVEDARLTMLKELALQPDGRLNQKLMSATLDAFAYRWPLGQVQAEMRNLAALGAVEVEEIKPGYLVASITRAGVEHLERRAFIDGIAQPSLGV